MGRALVILALSCLVACESHVREPPPELGDFGDDLCAPLGALLCERAATCGCGAITVPDRLDVARCMESFRARCIASNATAVDAGIVAERRLVREYIEELEAHPSCDEIEIEWGRGLAFFPVEVGEACPVEVGYCAGGRGLCFRGPCSLLPTEGRRCRLMLCGPGLRCDDDTEICLPLSREGEPCSQPRHCVTGLRCLDRTCRAPLPDGAACTTTEACATGLRCEAGACVPASRASCEECAAGDTCGSRAPRCRARRAEGDGCTEDRECTAELRCDEYRRCVPRPGLGESCSSGFVAIECAPGLQCVGTVCVAEGGLGDPCDAARPCADTLSCRDGLCGPLPGAGEPCPDWRCAPPLVCDADGICTPASSCTGDAECPADQHCHVATCVPDLATGSMCSIRVPYECAGACVRDESGAGVCVEEPRDVGDPCGTHDDCPIDLYCDSSEHLCVAGACENL